MVDANFSLILNTRYAVIVMIAGRNNIIQAFNGAMNFSHNVSYVVSHESPHFYRARIIKSARTISQEHGDLSQREAFESGCNRPLLQLAGI